MQVAETTGQSRGRSEGLGAARLWARDPWAQPQAREATSKDKTLGSEQRATGPPSSQARRRTRGNGRAAGLPPFSFRKVDGLHVLGHAIFKFLLKQRGECTIKADSPPRRRPRLTATSVTTGLPRDGLAAPRAQWGQAQGCLAAALSPACGARMQRSNVRQDTGQTPALRKKTEKRCCKCHTSENKSSRRTLDIT